MTAQFLSEDQRRLFTRVTTSLESVGYRGELLESNYEYLDWLLPETPVRDVPVACFGRLPAAYDTALIGVVLANGGHGKTLVNSHRALGSPLFVEVDSDAVRLWSVGVDEDATSQTHEFNGEGFSNWATENSSDLAPAELLRTKNLHQIRPQLFQGSLFAGLIPEMEERIADILEPRLTAAFQAGFAAYEKETGKPPAETALFKVAFWILTGKVFYDRKHSKFAGLGSNPTPDAVIETVAKHYKEPTGQMLTKEAREAVFHRIWTQMDFRNLSVNVLSQIWSRTLVTEQTRKRLGIHRTRSSIVNYIVERMPFEGFDRTECRVLEPCSGSASFLVASMDRMRNVYEFDTPLERHTYFKKMLSGYERDAFGVEISRLCLALADYPNPNHWKIEPEDVFSSESFKKSLGQSRIVLSNPPFRRFSSEEKTDFGAQLWEPPAELLRLVLDHLHPDGVIGFVLPRTFINGQWFADIRERIIGRFKDVEIVRLPDKGWDHADPETALLIATNPKRSAATSRVTYGIVREAEWQAFDWLHEIPTRSRTEVSPERARESLVVSELQEVWDYLAFCPTVGEKAVAHRGLRWQLSLRDNFDELVKNKPAPGYVKGVKPKTKKLFGFQVPEIAHLSIKPEHKRYKAFDLPWDKPKVIMNKVAKARAKWRVAAFADESGLVCSESYIPIWPNDPKLVQVLAAVLNGPIANAFLTENSGKREFVYDVIYKIPFPILTERRVSEIDKLVDSYVNKVENDNETAADSLLRQIDAAVLSAYGLPPRLERRVLDHFNGASRKVPFRFADYFPASFEPCFSLADWLTGKPARATVDAFRTHSRDIPAHILKGLQKSVEE